MKICVFGASSRELAQGYYDAAFELGAELARRGHELVFGGGTSCFCAELSDEDGNLGNASVLEAADLTEAAVAMLSFKLFD